MSPEPSILLPPKSWTNRELLKSPKCRNLSTLTFLTSNQLTSKICNGQISIKECKKLDKKLKNLFQRTNFSCAA